MKLRALAEVRAYPVANRSRKGAARLKHYPGIATPPGANRSRKGAARLKPLGAGQRPLRLQLLTAPERGRHD